MENVKKQLQSVRFKKSYIFSMYDKYQFSSLSFKEIMQKELDLYHELENGLLDIMTEQFDLNDDRLFEMIIFLNDYLEIGLDIENEDHSNLIIESRQALIDTLKERVLK